MELLTHPRISHQDSHDSAEVVCLMLQDRMMTTRAIFSWAMASAHRIRFKTEMKIIQNKNGIEDFLCLFEFSDLGISDRRLLVNISQSIVSLLPGKNDQGAPIIAQRLLAEAEMRVLLPLLSSPTCCQQAVLQASRACAYEFLLQSLFFSNVSIRLQWDKLVQEQRDRLYRASEQKVQRTEMRGVYNALFVLRPKLEQFGLTVQVRREGYSLTPLK